MDRFYYGVACALEDVPQNWPINLRGGIEYLCDRAKYYGYDAIELQMSNPQNYDWKLIQNTAEQFEIKICAVATGRELTENGLSLISDDPGVRRAAIDRLKLHTDMCRVFGAILIEGSMRSSIPDMAQKKHYLSYLDEATEEIVSYATGQGVPVVIENITESISNYLNTIRQVTDYVRKFHCRDLGVHLDTFSMEREENDITGAVEYCAPELMYVHFSDSSRLYTGGGNVDFKRFMHALRAIRYRGYITVECRPYPTQDICVKNCIKYMKALEKTVDIERSGIN